MRAIFNLLFISIFALAFTEETSIPPSKGLIVYIDGISASGKSTIAKEIMKSEYFTYLSTDEYAEKHNERFYKSAVITFKEAVAHASNGERVLLDSFIVENYFTEAKSEDFDMVTVGVWCSLACLKQRFDDRAKEPGAHKRSQLESDYRGRYGDMPAKDIVQLNGQFRYSPQHVVKYDLFLDAENMTPEQMAQSLSAYLEKRFAKPKVEEKKKSKKKVEETGTMTEVKTEVKTNTTTKTELKK